MYPLSVMFVICIPLSFSTNENTETGLCDCSMNNERSSELTCLQSCPKCYTNCTFFAKNLGSIIFNAPVAQRFNGTKSMQLQIRISSQFVSQFQASERCSFIKELVGLDKHGKITNATSVETIALAKISILQQVKIEVSYFGGLVSGKLTCKLWNNITIESASVLLTTLSYGKISAPGNLKTYFGKRRHGKAEELPHVTFQWKPIDRWPSLPSGYEVTCYWGNMKICDNSVYAACLKNFSSCSSCLTNLTTHTDWLVFDNTFFLDNFTTTFPEDGTGFIVCAVRGYTEVQKSPWSSPASVNFEVNPPPHLAFCTASSYNIIKIQNANSAVVLWKEVTLSSQRAARKAFDVEHFNLQRPDLPNVILIDVVKIENPLYQKDNFSDFCLNWIAGSHFESTYNEEHRMCIKEFDDVLYDEEKIFYIAAAFEEIQQLICNPLEDFVAFTVTSTNANSEEMIDIRILFLADCLSDESKLVSLQKSHLRGKLLVTYPLQNSSSIPLASPAISINWVDQPASIIFPLKRTDGDLSICTFHPKYNAVKCFHGQIHVSQEILKICIDWSHVYMLLQDSYGETTIEYYKWRRNASGKQIIVSETRTKLDTLWINNNLGKHLEQSLQDGAMSTAPIPKGITDLMVVAPDTRILPQPHEFFPIPTLSNFTSVYKKTLILRLHLKYPTNKYSMLTLFTVKLRYKVWKSTDQSNYCSLSIIPCIEKKLMEPIRRGQKYYNIKLEGLDENIYHVEASIENFPWAVGHTTTLLGHKISFTHSPRPKSPPPKISIWIILPVLILLVIFITVSVIVMMQRPQWKLLKTERIQSNQLDLQEIVGGGNEAVVYKGTYAFSDAVRRKVEKIVAVKESRPNSDQALAYWGKTRLLQEAMILQHCKHKNIVKLLGYCFNPKPGKLVLEYYECGNLKEYFKNVNSPVMVCIRLQIAIDIARACHYLEGKKYVHRDVRAANVLIKTTSSKNFERAVLSDFGLAADLGSNGILEYNIMKELVVFPIKHSAPEAFSGKFSVKSDVYSFGTLVFEIYTDAKRQPFPSIKGISTMDLMGKIVTAMKDGCKPCSEIPNGCPRAAFELMKFCWELLPENRPDFSKVLEDLNSIMVACGSLKPKPSGVLHITIFGSDHCGNTSRKNESINNDSDLEEPGETENHDQSIDRVLERAYPNVALE